MRPQTPAAARSASASRCLGHTCLTALRAVELAPPPNSSGTPPPPPPNNIALDPPLVKPCYLWYICSKTLLSLVYL